MAEIVDFGLQQHKIKMDSRYFENVLSVVAGDTGRRIEVQLLDTNGMVQNTTGLNLRLNAVIEGKATYTDATLVDATTGKYQLDLSNGMFLAPGNWEFQWRITDSAGKKLHSFAFTGNVGSNISEGGSQATNFYLNLEDLKAMQDDLVNGTIDSSILETNITEKLTNLETQYAPKLTEVTAQLEQKTTKGEIGITDLDKNKTQFDETWISDSLKQQILGNTPLGSVPPDESITKIKIAYRAVGPKQTDFIKGGTDDLFDKLTVVLGRAISGTNGSLEVFSNTAVSAPITVFPNTTYEIDKSLGSNSYGTGFYDENNIFISAAYPPDISKHSLKYQVKTPTNAKIMRVTMLASDVSTQKITELRFTLDSSLVEIEDGAVKKEHLSDIEIANYNLYKSSDLIRGSFIGSDGLPTGTANTSYVKIPIAGQNFVSIFRGSQIYTNATGTIGFTDSAGNLISYIIPSSDYLSSYKYKDKLFLTLPVPQNASFLQLTTKASFGNDEENLIVSSGTIVRGMVLQSFFGAELGNSILNGDKEKRVLEGKKGVSFGDSITWYDGRVFSTTHVQSGTQAKGYQSYMREYLGCSVDNQGESGWNLTQIVNKILAYDFSDKDFATLTSGANDNRVGIPIGTIQPIGSTFNTTTFIGSLQKAIEHILTQKPSIKIYLLTPIKGWYHESGTTNVPNTAPDTIGVMSVDIPNAIKAVGNLYSLPVCDLYDLSGINELTKDSVPLIGDNNAVFTAYDLHPTNEGYKRMADVLIPFFKSHTVG